jgi:hypothetical protein
MVLYPRDKGDIQPCTGVCADVPEFLADAADVRDDLVGRGGAVCFEDVTYLRGNVR